MQLLVNLLFVGYRLGVVVKLLVRLRLFNVSIPSSKRLKGTKRCLKVLFF